MANTEQKILTEAEARQFIESRLDFDKNKHPIVMWLYRNRDGELDVEVGNVLFITESGQVDILWLEGYKSRNDTVTMAEILAIVDKTAADFDIAGPRGCGGFTGSGHLTQAGLKWTQEHPRT